LVFVLNNFTHLEGACGQVRGRASAVLAVEHHEIFFVAQVRGNLPVAHCRFCRNELEVHARTRKLVGSLGGHYRFVFT